MCYSSLILIHNQRKQTKRLGWCLCHIVVVSGHSSIVIFIHFHTLKLVIPFCSLRVFVFIFRSVHTYFTIFIRIVNIRPFILRTELYRFRLLLIRFVFPNHNFSILITYIHNTTYTFTTWYTVYMKAEWIAKKINMPVKRNCSNR